MPFLILFIRVLSTFQAIYEWPVAAVLVMLSAGSVLLVRREFQRYWPERRRPVLTPISWVLILAVALSCIILCAVGFHYPINNWDSLTYHLARAALWRQWHSLDPFPTNYPSQVAFPGNAEVLVLVTMLVTSSARLAFTIQFSAYLMSVLAVYRLGRQLQVAPSFAFLAAATFSALPVVELESTTAQNDLTMAAFLACGLTFFLDFWRTKCASSIVLTGAALGLAVGTKPTALLALPGFAVGAFLLLWPERRRLQLQIAVPAAAGVLLALLLAAPWYIENWLHFGDWTGPALINAVQRVPHPTFFSFYVLLMRHVISFIDPTGVLTPSHLTLSLFCSRADTLRTLGSPVISMSRPTCLISAVPTLQQQTAHYSEDLGWFGLAGAGTLLCTFGFVLFSIFAWLRRKEVYPGGLLALCACLLSVRRLAPTSLATCRRTSIDRALYCWALRFWA